MLTIKVIPFPKLYVKASDKKVEQFEEIGTGSPDSSVEEEATHCVWPLILKSKAGQVLLGGTRGDMSCWR